jgi:large subunit ribosomal protein L25
MTETLRFEAELKEIAGKGSARAARREGKVPCVVYGGKGGQVMFNLQANKLDAEIKKGGFRTKLVDIVLDGKTITTLPKEMQLHPVTDAPEHVDFLRIDKNTIVKVAVAIKVLNEDKSPGVKRGGVVNVVHRTVMFECHPSNIPHHIEVDVGSLEIGHNVHITSIKLPEGVKPVDKTNFTVVSITGRTEESDKPTVAADAAATPAAATPAAGAKAAPAAKAPAKKK